MANREGRFEIIITNDPDPIVTLGDGAFGDTVSVTTKKLTFWHTVWRGDGNLRIVTTGENLTSKRNAIKNIEAFPGVKQVKHTTDGKMFAYFGREKREVVVIDQRS